MTGFLTCTYGQCISAVPMTDMKGTREQTQVNPNSYPGGQG